MSPEDFEKQVQDELRTTENLIYYLAGRLEIDERAGLEDFQVTLESNKALISELYKRYLSKKEDKA
jgi:hypothetical protein